MSPHEFQTMTSVELIGWLLEHGSSLKMHWQESSLTWAVVWVRHGNYYTGSAAHLRGALLVALDEAHR